MQRPGDPEINICTIMPPFASTFCIGPSKIFFYGGKVERAVSGTVFANVFATPMLVYNEKLIRINVKLIDTLVGYLPRVIVKCIDARRPC